MFKRIICAALGAVVLLFAVSGCEKSVRAQPGVPPFGSYRNIPGITGGEIEAIEKLIAEYDYFVYGMPLSTEAFTDASGEIKGFSSLLCQWLSELFGIEFVPGQYEWIDLLGALEKGEVDFTGEMRSTQERLDNNYFMTDSIAERILRCYHIAGKSLAETEKSRPVKYALIEGSAHTVLDYLEPGTYEMSYIDHIDNVYDKLTSGEIDAFIHSNTVEANFLDYGDVVSEDFFPMINSPVSLTTHNKNLEPFISVMQKALQADGVRAYLIDLYKSGYAEYMRYAYFSRLTGEETEYIKNNPVVSYAAENSRYPICFYETHSGEWQGIAVDILKEIEFLTGLSFQNKNNKNNTFPEMLNMLENGEVSMITELIQSTERAGRFIWTGHGIMTDYYALLSKSDYPVLRVNEVIHVRVGLLKNTAHSEVFKVWFPLHSNITEYDGIDEAVESLDRGEIDVIMTSESRLLYLTHYHERPDFKVNITFDTTFTSGFGFNRNEEVLCSVIDKALGLVNAEAITRQWMGKTFDYRSKLMEAQRPWLFGAIILSVCVIFLITVLFIAKSREEKRLEKVVDERTGELKTQTALLEEQTASLTAAEQEAKNASEIKSRFIANMSHEMRTPMNVVVGLTDLMLEEKGLAKSEADNLKKINISSKVMLRLISDILDVSKIESGKFELNPKQYDMTGLLNDVAAFNSIRTEGKPINFILDISDSLPSVLYGDDLRLRQVLNNLLSNAFKYTRKGTVTLGLSCERGDGEDVWLSFYVSDTGVGIQPENAAKLFSDYNQSDTGADRKTAGTGLGLGIVQKIIEQMDGEITVESEYGKGSAFRGRVRQGFVSDKPIGAEAAGTLRDFQYLKKNRKEGEAFARPDLSYIRVLLVDDFPTNLDVGAGFLRKYKMQVDCVLSGQEAIDKIKSGEKIYDAIFMDHMMPEMDGMEALKLIREIGTEYATSIPVIALTANAIEGNEQLFLENGFQAFLPKPINIMKLDSIVQKWIRDTSRE